MFGTRSFVQQMEPEMLAEFESEIRRWGYGQSERLVSWLAERGVKSSRSAVCRYEVTLRTRDGVNAMGGSHKAFASVHTSSPQTLLGLYQSLGEIEFEREQLLERIREKLDDIEFEEENGVH